MTSHFHHFKVLQVKRCIGYRIALLYNTVGPDVQLKERIKIAESEIPSFLSHAFFSLVKTLASILPTMQLGRRQFGRRFRCVMLVAANEASSR